MDLKLQLSKEHFYIVSVSGGVDSMVLFDLMVKKRFRFAVVHFNHQTRSEAIFEHQLISGLCQKYDVPYHYITLQIKGGSFQAKARKLRHKHLEHTAQHYATQYIVTAHHADDQIETIFMKLLRGSNLLGYGGMQKLTKIRTFLYLKPLLSYKKDDLIDYAKTHKVTYFEDRSNLEDDYLRNRLRHHIIPELKSESNLYLQLNTFSNQVIQAFNVIRKEVLQFLNDQNHFSLRAFLKLDEALQFDLLAYLLESVDVAKSYQKLKNIFKQLTSKKPNVEISLNKHYVLVKSYDRVEIMHKDQLKMQDSLPVLTISHKRAPSTNNSIELCYNELDFPITLRFRQQGDLLSFPYGRKKLKKFLIDQKIPVYKRDQLLILVDGKNQILWIPHLYVNQTLGDKKKIYVSLEEKNDA